MIKIMKLTIIHNEPKVTVHLLYKGELVHIQMCFCSKKLKWHCMSKRGFVTSHRGLNTKNDEVLSYSSTDAK